MPHLRNVHGRADSDTEKYSEFQNPGDLFHKEDKNERDQ